MILSSSLLGTQDLQQLKWTINTFQVVLKWEIAFWPDWGMGEARWEMTKQAQLSWGWTLKMFLLIIKIGFKL